MSDQITVSSAYSTASPTNQADQASKTAAVPPDWMTKGLFVVASLVLLALAAASGWRTTPRSTTC